MGPFTPGHRRHSLKKTKDRFNLEPYFPSLWVTTADKHFQNGIFAREHKAQIYTGFIDIYGAVPCCHSDMLLVGHAPIPNPNPNPNPNSATEKLFLCLWLDPVCNLLCPGILPRKNVRSEFLPVHLFSKSVNIQKQNCITILGMGIAVMSAVLTSHRGGRC